MSDVQQALDWLKDEISDLKLPGFIEDIRGDILEEIGETGAKAIAEDMSVQRFKPMLTRHCGEIIQNWWSNDCPWYLRFLRGFVMPPVMKPIRGWLKRI